MAHEVNNPLEAIGNLLYLVENCGTLEEAQSFGRMAIQELRRISEIIDRTLRFHRTPAKPTVVNLLELAASALALFGRKIHEQDIAESLAGPRTYAYCAEGEIRQALVNLIGNAVDAMPEGGQLQLRVSPVTIDGQSYARLTVADTGSGIRSEVRPNLFTQFFTTKGSRGTGLGLWLTRDIVQRNQGRLRFRSRAESPSGTVFSIYLPAANSVERLQSERLRADGAPAGIEAA